MATQNPSEAEVRAMMAALGEHESGMDYTQHHDPKSNITASGAYQYTDGTWGHYKGYAHAWQAPKAVQDERMHQDVVSRYRAYGGDWTKVIVAHFYPAWANHPEKWGTSPTADQPGLHNPTMNDYIASVAGKFNKYKGGTPIPLGVNATGASTGTLGSPLPAGQVESQSSSINPDGSISYGASTTGGVGASGEAAWQPGAAGKPTANQIRDYALGHYGYLAYFLDIPEVSKKIMDGVENGWSPEALLGALTNTKWYKTLSDSQRAWDYKVKSDPGQVKALLGDEVAHLTTQARQMGFNLDPHRAATMATSILRNNQQNDTETVRKLVGAEYKYVAPAPGAVDKGNIGLAGDSIDQFKKMSQDYLVPLSDATIGSWTKAVLQGTQTAADFEHYVKEQAKRLHPDMAGAIDGGVTTRQYLEPYLQVMSQEMEKPVESFDLFDPKVMSLLTPKPDPAQKGVMTMPSLADLQNTIRSQTSWRGTQRAVSMASSFAEKLDKTFGKVG